MQKRFRPSALLLPLLALISCVKEDTGNPYDGRIRFECRGIQSKYFVSATVGDDLWCYSDTDLFYVHFAMVGSVYITYGDSVIIGNGGLSGYTIIMGLGGLGVQPDGTIAPPAPQFVFLETPDFTESPKDFVLNNLYEGAELDILQTLPKTKNGGKVYNEKAFNISLYTQYYSKSYPYNRYVVTFRSGTGVQDENAYARVTGFSLNKEGTYDVTIEFRCKLYDNGKFFREIKDGIMRFKLDINKL